MTESGWKNAALLNKLRTILMRFNYPMFGKSIISSALVQVGNSLSQDAKSDISDFIDRLNNTESLNLTTVIHYI